MNQDSTKTSAGTIDSKELHPCGLTWERWYWPWKMPQERAMIQQWKERHNVVLDTTDNPF